MSHRLLVGPSSLELTSKKALLTTLAPLVLLCLSGCSSDLTQADGNMDYLKAPDLVRMKAPDGMILPLQNSLYDIPATNGNAKKIGSAVDIRPPAQFLSLLPDSQSKVQGDVASMILNNQQLDNSLWLRVVQLFKEKAYPIAQQQTQGQTLTTDWIDGERLGENKERRARYQISDTANLNQQILTVKLLDLQDNNKTVTDPVERQRSAIQMLNTIVIGLDRQINGKAPVDSTVKTAAWQVQSGADDTGLPAIIVRNNYDTVWQALPSALATLGMKVSGTDKDKGTLQANYQGDKLTALAKGVYQVRVENLDNRSRIQFLNENQQPVSQSVNDELVSVLQQALAKQAAK